MGKVSNKEMDLRNNLFALHGSFLRIFQQRKALHVNGIRMPLYDLVLKYSVSKEIVNVGAKLPEDRIYGFMGLALDDEIRRMTEVKYDGTRDVYTRFAGLVARENLDVLLFSQNATKSEISLPSWVPDWSAAELRIPYGYSNLTTPLFSAGGNTIEQLPIFDLEQGGLTVQGYIVDRISRNGTFGIEKKLGNTMEQIDFPSLKRFSDEIHGFLEQAKGIEGSRFQHDASQHLRDTAAINLCDGGLSSREFATTYGSGTTGPTVERVHSNFYNFGQALINSERMIQSSRIIRTIGFMPWYCVPGSEVDVLRLCATAPLAAALKWLQGVRDFVTDMVRVISSSMTVKLNTWFGRSSIDLTLHNSAVYEHVRVDPELPRTPQWRHYTTNLYKTVGRRLFLTPRGFIGLGPADMQKGDVVAVLVGSSVPHVLRPSLSTSTPAPDSVGSSARLRMTDETLPISANANWSYVGEAYCENIMGGEILEERAWQATQFRIL